MTDFDPALIEQAARVLLGFSHGDDEPHPAHFWPNSDAMVRARAVLEEVAPAIREQAIRDAAGWPPLVDYRARGGQIESPVCCRACTPAYPLMLVCSACGNKRCPHAWDHANRCTGSNEPDQAPERADQINPKEGT